MRLSDIKGQAHPQYRFHGSVPPEAGRGAKVRALLQPVDDGDGTTTMRIYDVIDSWGGDWGVSATEFAEVLATLDDGTKEIRLHINSPGGEVFEGIAILNQLRSHPARVVAVVDGIAASAASFIAAGADETVMGRNTELMIHDAWGLCIGNSADMADMGGRLSHLSDNIASVYAEKAGGTVDDWRAAMVAETWFSADEAVAAGLADRVAEGEKPEAAKNEFDLSVFAHAGRKDAPVPRVPADQEPTTELSALQGRRHRMNARKLGIPA